MERRGMIGLENISVSKNIWLWHAWSETYNRDRITLKICELKSLVRIHWAPKGPCHEGSPEINCWDDKYCSGRETGFQIIFLFHLEIIYCSSIFHECLGHSAGLLVTVAIVMDWYKSSRYALFHHLGLGLNFVGLNSSLCGMGLHYPCMSSSFEQPSRGAISTMPLPDWSQDRVKFDLSFGEDGGWWGWWASTEKSWWKDPICWRGDI